MEEPTDAQLSNIKAEVQAAEETTDVGRRSEQRTTRQAQRRTRLVRNDMLHSEVVLLQHARTATWTPATCSVNTLQPDPQQCGLQTKPPDVVPNLRSPMSCPWHPANPQAASAGGAGERCDGGTGGAAGGAGAGLWRRGRSGDALRLAVQTHCWFICMAH